MSCDRRIWGDDEGLRCVEVGAHVTHRFESSTVSDKHDATEAMDE